ncbi:MAG: hypothetical protein U0T11_08680 [Chitinophagaceae bacterium]
MRIVIYISDSFYGSGRSQRPDPVRGVTGVQVSDTTIDEEK